MTGVNSQFFSSCHGTFQKIFIHGNRGQIFFCTCFINQIKNLISVIITTDSFRKFQFYRILAGCCVDIGNMSWNQQKK